MILMKVYLSRRRLPLCLLEYRTRKVELLCYLPYIGAEEGGGCTM